jgi:hypothetical protein
MVSRGQLFLLPLVLFIFSYGCKKQASQGRTQNTQQSEDAAPGIGEKAMSLAQRLDLIDNYAECELAPMEPQPPFAELGRCVNFSATKPNGAQGRVDGELQRLKSRYRGKVPNLRDTFRVEISHDDSCFFESKADRDRPIADDNLRQIFAQVEQAVAFLGEVHVILRGATKSYGFSPLQVEICSTEAGSPKYLPLAFDPLTRVLRITMEYGSGPGMTPVAETSQSVKNANLFGYRVLRKEELLEQWRGGKGIHRDILAQAFKGIGDGKTLGPEIEKRLVRKFEKLELIDKSSPMDLWRILDPLGVTQEAIEALIAGYQRHLDQFFRHAFDRTEKVASLTPTSSPSEESRQTTIADRLAAITVPEGEGDAFKEILLAASGSDAKKIDKLLQEIGGAEFYGQIKERLASILLVCRPNASAPTGELAVCLQANDQNAKSIPGRVAQAIETNGQTAQKFDSKFRDAAHGMLDEVLPWQILKSAYGVTVGSSL